MGFAFFIVTLILLIAATMAGLDLVDRIVVGDWGIRPVCKKPRLIKFRRHTFTPQNGSPACPDKHGCRLGTEL